MVCAAGGCPPQRNEANDSLRLDLQLGEQSRYVYQHATWFHFDARSNVLRLTKRYEWYGDDFDQLSGGTRQFAACYSLEVKQALESGATPRIEWLPYDWKLNSLEVEQPAKQTDSISEEWGTP